MINPTQTTTNPRGIQTLKYRLLKNNCLTFLHFKYQLTTIINNPDATGKMNPQIPVLFIVVVKARIMAPVI